MNDDSKSKRKIIRKITEHPFPRNSLDVLHRVIKLFYYANAHQNPITAPDLSKKYNERQANISNQTKFFSKVEILEQMGHKYKLTEDGRNLAVAIDGNDEVQIYRIWRNLLKRYDVITDFLTSLKARDKAYSDTDFINQLRVVFGVKKPLNEITREQRAGLGAIRDLLLNTGYITKNEDGNYVYNEENLEDQENEPDSVEEQSSFIDRILEFNPNRGFEYSSEEGIVSLNLDINLSISGTDSPEKVKDLILSIRRALIEPLDSPLLDDATDEGESDSED